MKKIKVFKIQKGDPEADQGNAKEKTWSLSSSINHSELPPEIVGDIMGKAVAQLNGIR